MSDDLTRLLELPALARLSAASGELQLITLTHDHADRVTIERRHLGTSIDLHELLGIIGGHGLADAPQIEVSAPPVPELPAPVDAPVATARRTRKHPESLVCVDCEQAFTSPDRLLAHMAMKQLQTNITEKQQALEEASREWPCPDCEKVFATAQALGSNSKAHKHETPGKPAERFVCPTCRKVYRSQSGYNAHTEIAHAAPAASVPAPVANEYTCGACNEPLIGHLRCSDCAALLGPKHDAGEPLGERDGKPLCSVCVKYHQTVEALELV